MKKFILISLIVLSIVMFGCINLHNSNLIPNGNNKSIENNANVGDSSLKTVELDSETASGIDLSTGKIYPKYNKKMDLFVEPWCTDNPGICGNWVNTHKGNFDEVTSVPSTGYLSDNAGYMDCQEVVLNKVYVNKNKDGTYTKFKIISDDYRKSDSGCQHKITMEYINVQ